MNEQTSVVDDLKKYTKALEAGPYVMLETQRVMLNKAVDEIEFWKDKFDRVRIMYNKLHNSKENK